MIYDKQTLGLDIFISNILCEHKFFHFSDFLQYYDTLCDTEAELTNYTPQPVGNDIVLNYRAGKIQLV